MKIENVIRITADEGKVITNGKSFGSSVVINDSSKVADYYEVSRDEYFANRAEKEASEAPEANG